MARQRSTAAWGDEWDEDRRIFVLDSPFPTSFQKATKGGMMGTKQYFFIGNLKPPARDAKELASSLKDKTWAEVGSGEEF